MHSTWDAFIAAYNSASLEVRQLIDSETIADFVDALAEKYSLAPQNKKIIIAQLADLVLDIATIEETINRVTEANNIEDAAATEFAKDIKDFHGTPFRTHELSPLNLEPQQPSREETEPPSVAEPQPTSQFSHATPQPTPTLSDRLQALRTMRSDADRIHGYGAYRRKYPDASEQNKPQASAAGAHAELPQYSNDSRR